MQPGTFYVDVSQSLQKGQVLIGVTEVAEVCAVNLKFQTLLMNHVGANIVPHDGICFFQFAFFKS